jgi:carbonic anhydrase
MKNILFAAAFCLNGIIFANTGHTLDPNIAIKILKEGNERFVKEKLEHPDRALERRLDTKYEQTPFAVILGCSDSRVPPEIIFDVGLGDLFVVRVAGNVLGDLEFESIKYSLLANRSCLVVVLGHQNCGAVQAVLKNKTQDIEEVAKLIEPAILESTSLEKAIMDNVRYTVNHLKKSPIIEQLESMNTVKIIGGYYDFKTGKVNFFD